MPKSCVAGILNEGPGSLRKLTILYQTWSCKDGGISEPFAMKAFITVSLFGGLNRFNQNFPFLEPPEELVPGRTVTVYLCLEQATYTELIIALQERILKTFISWFPTNFKVLLGNMINHSDTGRILQEGHTLGK